MSTGYQIAEGFTQSGTELSFCEFAEGKPLLNYDEVADFAERGKHSFLDAVLIGKYNGGTFLFVLEEPKEDPDNPDKSLKPYWKLVPTYTNSKGEVMDNLKYVNNVCNEN